MGAGRCSPSSRGPQPWPGFCLRLARPAAAWEAPASEAEGLGLAGPACIPSVHTWTSHCLYPHSFAKCPRTFDCPYRGS